MIFNMVGKGGGGSLLISDTLDAAGGTIRTITATKTVKLQTKTITPTSSIQVVDPDTGYDGFSQVTVGAGSGGSNLQTKTYTVDSAGIATVTADSGYDGLSSVTVSVPSADPFVNIYGSSFYTEGNQRKWREYPRMEISVADGDKEGWLSDGYSKQGEPMSYNAVPSGTVITPTESSQTIGGSNYMMEGAVTVNAIPSNYVGSGITQRSSSDLTASTLTVTAPSGYYASNATKTLTDANLVAGNIKKDVPIFGVTGTYEGGSESDVQVASATLYSASTSALLFTGLHGEPTSFIALCSYTLTPSATPQVVAVVYDGTSLHAQTITNTSNAQVSYASTGFSYFYNSGALTVESTGSAVFNTSAIDTYGLIYTYDGTSDNIHTADVQVGSGATSITFTGLEDEPLFWSCIFKSNFGTSSGYQRVITTADNGDSVIGYEMDSSAHPASHWTSSYNNGSLTITSQGTNAGGYFHQPGYYQLTYAIEGGSGSTVNLQEKTNINPTTSSQTITADAGYDGLSSVQINAMPTMTLPTSAASSATSGYTSKATIGRSTSAQYINIPTGYNSAGAYYTISATPNGSATGPSSLSGTSATVSTGTNTITLTKTGVTTTPTVSAGYVSSATASTATVTLTASVTTRAAATITPGTTNQTIASGTYLTGTQTIEGDADLVGSNILSTANIFGVQGQVVVQNYYTGSSAPSSSTGSNGDLYLQS